jgi:anti-anti-sigma factor
MRKRHLQVKEYNRNAVVRAPGSLGKDIAEHVGAAMVSCLNKGDTRLVLDLGAAAYINSDGLRMLQEVQRRAETLEASLALANPNDRVMRTLNMTQMDRQLQIYESVEDALGYNKQ